MSAVTTGSNDLDSTVRVLVTPSQSSYFAGEPFSVTITFTNTYSPEVDAAQPSRSFASPNIHVNKHKRGAHSISSAPLARPPTSPGAPRTATHTPPPRSRSGDGTLSRKGLIGKGPKGAEELPELLEQRRTRQLARSLSVTIAPFDVEVDTMPHSAPFTRRSFAESPTSPHVPSPLSRNPSLPLSSNHPHARKQSVLDGQVQFIQPQPIVTQSPYLPTHNASTSTSSFSLALDPISESAPSPYPPTPAISSPTLETPSASVSSFPPEIVPKIDASHSYPPRPPPPPPQNQPKYNSRRPSHLGLGLGQPPATSNSNLSPRTAPSTSSSFPHRSSTFPPSTSHGAGPSQVLILYSYAQLTGSLTLTPLVNPVPTPSSPSTRHTTESQLQAHTLNALRATLLGRTRAVVGGGSMDITASLSLNSSSSFGSAGLPQQRLGRRKGHSRSASFGSGLLSLLSPSSFLSSTPSSASSYLTTSTSSGPPLSRSASGGQWKHSRSRTQSQNFLSGLTESSPSPSPSSAAFPLSSPNSGGKSEPGSGVGLGLGSLGSSSSLAFNAGIVEEDDIDPELPLPTFEVQPAMLAVDLVLSPGESKTYTYTIPLPTNLPPTFKGRSLKFSYELVVGTCRAGTGGGGSISRVMKVPIRVYNNVSVGRLQRPYDLLWPVAKRIGPGSLREPEGKVAEVDSQTAGKIIPPSPIPGPKARNGTGTYEDLQQYAQRLLASFPEPGASGVRMKLPVEAVDNVRLGELEEERAKERQKEREDEGGLTGCREAVEILTRIPKKASYDVTKDGVKVAVLTFTKSAYRLGETVLGVVEVNSITSRARVLKLSAILEAQESLPSSISSPSNTRHLRRVHAEHHSSFTLSTLRTTFSLDIPSDASPAFQVEVGPNGFSPIVPPSDSLVKPGGLEWKVRLCLLVAVAAESSNTGTEGVRIKGLVKDGRRGEWGCAWKATPEIAPMEKPIQNARVNQTVPTTKSWSSFFAGPFLGGTTEREYHDGDDLDIEEDDDDEGAYDGVKGDKDGGVGVGVNFGGGEKGWEGVNLETVECEVPIRVWPGNTAFKALDVVFEV